MSLNKATLIGNLGNDPDVKKTPNGNSVATFSLATNERWTDKSGEKKEHVEWHRVVVWGKLADIVGQYCKKGKQVYVEGKIRTRSWEDKDKVKRYTTEINADTVQFLGGGGEGGGVRPPHPAEQPAQTGAATAAAQEPNWDESDVPF